MSKKILLSKFMILCRATFAAILGHMWPAGRKLDTPGQIQYCNTPMYRAVKLSKNRSENLSCQRETNCSTNQGGDDYAPETS